MPLILKTKVQLFSQYGIVLFELGFIENSIDNFERSICIFPDEPDLYINLSNIHKLNGDLEKSEILIRNYRFRHIKFSHFCVVNFLSVRVNNKVKTIL